MNNDHLIEKHTNALESLALGKGNIKERLIYVSDDLIGVNPNEIPEEFKSDWKWIQEQLSKFGPVTSPSGEVWVGSVENTMKKIRKSTGVKIANKIYSLYWAVSSNEKYT